MNDTPLFGAWLASRKLVAAAGLFCALSGVLIFWLYGLPGEAIAYLLCLGRTELCAVLEKAQDPSKNGGSNFCDSGRPAGDHHID